MALRASSCLLTRISTRSYQVEKFAKEAVKGATTVTATRNLKPETLSAPSNTPEATTTIGQKLDATIEQSDKVLRNAVEVTTVKAEKAASGIEAIKSSAGGYLHDVQDKLHVIQEQSEKLYKKVQAAAQQAKTASSEAAPDYIEAVQLKLRALQNQSKKLFAGMRGAETVEANNKEEKASISGYLEDMHDKLNATLVDQGEKGVDNLEASLKMVYKALKRNEDIIAHHKALGEEGKWQVKRAEAMRDVYGRSLEAGFKMYISMKKQVWSMEKEEK